MILTVTPNPSIDLLFDTDGELRWDDANRVAEPRRRPGGQGINLTRAVRVLGGDSRAIAFLGGHTGHTLAADLQKERTPVRAIAIAGETRTFVAVRETATGRSMLINPRGPDCTAADAERMVEAVADELRTQRPAWLVASGSVPPGIDTRLHARIGGLAREHGVSFVADCDGPALRDAARAGVCDMLVPNRHEAFRLTGADPCDPQAAVWIARTLLAHARTVVIKLGPLGAVVATHAGAWHARPPEGPHEGSAVGAGDAFLAAFVLGLLRDAPPPEALADAVAAGTAVLHSGGSAILNPSDVPAIRAATRITQMS